MKYIDAEKLIVEIERRRDSALERQKNLEKIGQETVLNEMIAFELNRLISFIDSLQQEPPIHTELCTLIACDVIQATAKRVIEKPQDKDKEEDLMIKKMEYLNMLEKSFFLQEQKEFNIPSDGSGAMGETPPKFKLDVKEQPASEGLEEEIKRFLSNATKMNKGEWRGKYPISDIGFRAVARHFAEWGAEHTKQKPELVQHPAISYMYNADAGRGEQMKQAILALLKSDLIQVAGRGFTKTELIEWVKTRPAEIKEDEL